MSDDLVKRLRAPTEHEAWLWSVPYQAADRIEQLEAALNDIVQHIASDDYDCLKPETRKTMDGLYD